MKIVEWKSVSPNSVWSHEAHDFTPWLAQNLHHVGAVIGEDLELVATEMAVGPFWADIVAETIGGQRVVIENQLHPADHSHFGQLLTYAGGLDAAHVVWVSAAFKPEYASALQWLNENTREELSFYALEIETVQVGTDEVSVKLEPRVLPDSGSKRAKSKATGTTPLEELYANFWSQLLDQLRQIQPGWSNATGPSASWVPLPARSSAVHYTLVFGANKTARVELYHQPRPGESSDELFKALHERRETIESAVGQPLDWDPMPDKKAMRISISRAGDVTEESSHPELTAWFIDTAVRFRSAFQPHLDAILTG